MIALLEASAAQCRYQLTIALRIIAGLDDSHLALEPMAGMKTAGWLLGHLAVTGDFARRLLGRRDAICPPAWRALFNPGTTPSHRREDYPAMEELCAAFRKVYEDLPSAALEANDMILAENPYEAGRDAFPRAGDFAAYLLSAHLSYHLGQLSGWRAAAGVKPVAR